MVQDLLGETSSDIVAPETMPLAITEMLNGNADASVGDNSTVNEYIKNNPDAKVETIEDDEFEKEYYGLMVKKVMMNYENYSTKESKRLKKVES